MRPRSFISGRSSRKFAEAITEFLEWEKKRRRIRERASADSLPSESRVKIFWSERFRHGPARIRESATGRIPRRFNYLKALFGWNDCTKEFPGVPDVDSVETRLRVVLR